MARAAPRCIARRGEGDMFAFVDARAFLLEYRAGGRVRGEQGTQKKPTHRKSKTVFHDSLNISRNTSRPFGPSFFIISFA